MLLARALLVLLVSGLFGSTTGSRVSVPPI